MTQEKKLIGQKFGKLTVLEKKAEERLFKPFLESLKEKQGECLL